jgi:hypothetical protein
VLCGCAGSTTAVFESLRYVVQKDSAAASARLNPDFRYLRITIDGRTALLVLGYVESHPEGPIEVWYSAEREVIRLQNGRIVGAVGLTTEWRNVTLSTSPAWDWLGRQGTAVSILRLRDVMPGYRYGVEDHLVLKPAPLPPRSELQELDPKQLAWFEESIETDRRKSALDEQNVLPIARYAVDLQQKGHPVLYGEQCLAPRLCFTWQRWPATPQNALR